MPKPSPNPVMGGVRRQVGHLGPGTEFGRFSTEPSQFRLRLFTRWVSTTGFAGLVASSEAGCARR